MNPKSRSDLEWHHHVNHRFVNHRFVNHGDTLRHTPVTVAIDPTTKHRRRTASPAAG